MFDEILFTVFFGLAVIVGFVIGMVYEHNRIMERFEEVAEEQNDIKPCCGNCLEYDGNRCMICWNNLDESYYVPERDDKDEYDCCDYWRLDRNALEDK